jgi:hypothetical protein
VKRAVIALSGLSVALKNHREVHFFGDPAKFVTTF